MTVQENRIDSRRAHTSAVGRPDDHRRLPVSRTAAVATVAAVAAWVLETRVADIELVVTQGGATMAVGVVSVAVSALVVALAAAGVARLVRRHAARPRRAWLVTGTMVLVLSLTGPFAQATTTGAALALALLHVVVAAAVVPLLAAALPGERVR